MQPGEQVWGEVSGGKIGIYTHKQLSDKCCSAEAGRHA